MDNQSVTMAKINMDEFKYMHFLNCTPNPIRLMLIPMELDPLSYGTQVIMSTSQHANNPRNNHWYTTT